MKLKCINWIGGKVEFWPIIRSRESAIEKANEWFQNVKPRKYTIKIIDDDGRIEEKSN